MGRIKKHQASEMKLLLALFLCFLSRHEAEIIEGESFSTAEANYDNFKQSIAFVLSLENYSNKVLEDPQYYEHCGYVIDKPQRIEPGTSEFMTGRKTSYSFSGVSGVVKWNIGDTGKMVVVVYDKPWSMIYNFNTLALGIFPKKDVVTDEDFMSFYNKMHYGEYEDGFHRDIFGSGIINEDDPDFAVHGVMEDAPKGLILIQLYPKAVSGLEDPDDEQLVNKVRLLGSD